MSPTRVITPRLEAAITETVRQLDHLIRCGEEVVQETPQKKLAAVRKVQLGLFRQLRAELLEAFEEARADQALDADGDKP
jgi:hypothetical protein